MTSFSAGGHNAWHEQLSPGGVTRKNQRATNMRRLAANLRETGCIVTM